MTEETRRAGALLLALGVIAAVVALAGPAAASSHGGATATDGSVASGSAHASGGSTASGHSTAIDGSVASGCSTAIDDSTASGGPCPRHHAAVHQPHRPAPAPVHRVAAPTPARLALTGSWTAPMALAATVAVLLGVALVVAGSSRRPVLARLRAR